MWDDGAARTARGRKVGSKHELEFGPESVSMEVEQSHREDVTPVCSRITGHICEFADPARQVSPALGQRRANPRPDISQGQCSRE